MTLETTRVEILLIGRKVPPLPQVPLADAARMITVLLKQCRNSQPILRNQRVAVYADDTRLELRAPIITTGQDTITRRRTDRRAGVGIGKYHALLSQTVDIRGLDLPLGI